MTLDEQMTDIDKEEKQCALEKKGLSQLYCALRLVIETQRNKPPKICTTILVQVSLIMESIKYYTVKLHMRGHQSKVVEHLV